MIVVKQRTKMPSFHRWDSYSIVEKIKENLTNPFELHIELSRIKKKKCDLSRRFFRKKIIKIRIFEFLKPSEKKKKNLDFTAIFEWLIGRSSVNWIFSARQFARNRAMLRGSFGNFDR